MAAIFVTDRDEMSNLYRGPSIDVSYQVSIHLTKRFQRRRFLEMYQSETRIACGGDVYSQNQDEMGNLYRGPSIYVSYQVSIHLTKRFQRRRFLEMYQSETRIACGGDVYSQNQDEMGNLYRGPSIDASYQVLVHLSKRFQCRRFF